MRYLKTFRFNNSLTVLSLIAAVQILTAPELVAEPKTYQVTGPILELTDKTIVVQKGNERWEIARDEATKVKGELKVGEKVTIHYKMTATSVETRGAAESKAKSR